MQSVHAILQISNHGVQLTDEFGAANSVELELMLGTAVRLEFDLRGESGPDGGELATYPIESFSGSAHYFALDSRNRNSNAPALLKYSGITLTRDDAGHNILSVELENNATEKIIEIVAGEEKAVLRAEIGGVDADGMTLFAWQFDIVIRSRVFIGQADEVIANDPAYYTAVQTLAMLKEQSAAIARELNVELKEDMNNPQEFQFSVDGELDWHSIQSDEDRYFRQRIANFGAEWSPAVMIFDTSGSEKADIGLANIDADGRQTIVDQIAYVPGSKQGGDNTTVFALNTVYEAEHDGIAYMWVKSASTSLCSVVLGSALDSELKNNYMYEKNSVSGIANTAVSAILFVPKGFHFRFWAENHNISAGYNFSFIPLKGTKL